MASCVFCNSKTKSWTYQNIFKEQKLNRGKKMQTKHKFFSSLVIVISILALSIGSCSPQPPTGVVTHTFTPSLTPTCLPVSLSTPEGWRISSHLYVIIYDPRSTENGVLGFENRETTQDVVAFIRKLAPELMNPGDQLSIFQLGYSLYEAAQVTRISSYTTIPPLYNTPSPGSTLTPLPEPTIAGGFGPIQATNQAKMIQTQRAFVEEQFDSEYNCQKNTGMIMSGQQRVSGTLLQLLKLQI